MKLTKTRAEKTVASRPAGSRFIWLLIIEHKYGNNTYVCATEDLALECLDKYVTDWWGQEMDGKELPILRADRIEEYFEHQGTDLIEGELYSLTKEEVLL